MPIPKPIVVFDASKPAHVAALKGYLTSGKWSIQFHLEHPYLDIPTMCMVKYAKYKLCTN